MRDAEPTSAAGMPSGGRHWRSTSCSRRTSRPNGSCSKFFLRSAEAQRWSQHLPKAAQQSQQWRALYQTQKHMHAHAITAKAHKNLLSLCYFFFSYPHADCQSHYKPHHHGRHWWSNSTFISIHSLANAHLPFLILPLFLSSLCVGTDRRCEHRRGCSWWCRLSSRPHTGTSNPPVQTVPPPVF